MVTVSMTESSRRSQAQYYQSPDYQATDRQADNMDPVASPLYAGEFSRARSDGNGPGA